MANINADYYDALGKLLFVDLLRLYNIPYTLTTYKYDKVDIYFGRSSVGEIKYRLRLYPSYIIEENKVEALASVPCSRQYYITVTDKDIYLWSLPTIRNFEPQIKVLPVDVSRTENTIKNVRYLPVTDADFHFTLKDELDESGAFVRKWKLIKFE